MNVNSKNRDEFPQMNYDERIPYPTKRWKQHGHFL